MSDKLKIMQERLPKPRRKKSSAETRLFGIDVSHYQAPIDWSRVKDAGCVFAILKATEASSYKDKNFPGWWPQLGVKGNGIVRGAYHFYRPYASPSLQSANFLSVLPKLEAGDLPPVLDLEVPENWRNISLKKRIAGVRQWLDSVEEKLGIKPIIYMSPSFAGDVLNSDPFLRQYLLWVANYRVKNPRVPAPWAPDKTWTIWQWSESGKLPGTSGSAVDLNWFNGSMDDLSSILVKA